MSSLHIIVNLFLLAKIILNITDKVLTNTFGCCCTTTGLVRTYEGSNLEFKLREKRGGVNSCKMKFFKVKLEKVPLDWTLNLPAVEKFQKSDTFCHSGCRYKVSCTGSNFK